MPDPAVITLLVVGVTAVIHSLFGVGILLFGTPLLLLVGYPFPQALGILLPASLSINLVQVWRDRASVDRGFLRRVLVFSLPAIAAALLITERLQVTLELVVGLMLVCVALLQVSSRVERAVTWLTSFDRMCFVVMGAVHGLTNLGGSLLTVLVHSRGYSKSRARATAAASYGAFALVQLVTLMASTVGAFPAPSRTAIHIGLALMVWLIVDTFVFSRMSAVRYRAAFAAFALVSGLLLVFRS